MVEMGNDRKVSCILCQRSEETKITGALSTKDQITAHQNCLLFSSGIYCQNSPEFDDLFGFSAEDVMNEVKRGSKLACSGCKKKGATAGCEVKRCKKSYHYPCAVQEGAHIVENEDMGNYTLYCAAHYEKMQRNGSTSEHESSSTNHRPSKNSSKTASSKRNGHDDFATAGRSFCSSDSNSASSIPLGPLKRQLSFSDKEEEMPSKKNPEAWKRIISDDSSDSVENEPNTEMAMFAPLESDLDESANSVPENQLIRKDTENGSLTGSISGNQLMDENRDGDKDEDETSVHSDADSESLLLPVEICVESNSTANTLLSNQIASPAHPSVINAVELIKSGDEGSSPDQNPVNSPEYVHSPGQHTAAPPVPLQISPGSPPSPDHCRPRIISCSSLRTSSAVSPAPPETICVSLPPSSSSPTAAPSDPAPSIDSTSFWRSCNAAGCTETIFTDFIDEMKDISSRIQSDQASQEDRDLALKVLAASGKLGEIVAKQQKELEKKQMQLQKAAAAMKKVVSALRR